MDTHTGKVQIFGPRLAHGAPEDEQVQAGVSIGVGRELGLSAHLEDQPSGTSKI